MSAACWICDGTGSLQGEICTGCDSPVEMGAVYYASTTAAKIAETVTARGEVYAAPEENFERIAEFWRMWMRWRYGADVPLTAADVGMMQAGIKLARQAETPTHEDSALDAAAYVLLAAGCARGAAA